MARREREGRKRADFARSSDKPAVLARWVGAVLAPWVGAAIAPWVGAGRRTTSNLPITPAEYSPPPVVARRARAPPAPQAPRDHQANLPPPRRGLRQPRVRRRPTQLPPRQCPAPGQGEWQRAPLRPRRGPGRAAWASRRSA